MRFRTIGGAMASRKKRRVYAFPGSATNLEERIAECKSKIDDPSDKDDKQWLLRWLKAAERRLAAKERSHESKQVSRIESRRQSS
jgi:hypothetical protein